jgi:dihydropteroate synthase
MSSPPVARIWRLRGFDLMLDRPRIMGVVNVTPDSFSDGGEFLDADAAIGHGLRLVEEGADLIDVGGESTRPGAAAVSVDEELDRVVAVVEALTAAGALVSIDTSKAPVADGAIEAGAVAINDVTALGDPDMAAVASRHKVGLVLMHMQGRPQTMQTEPSYDDVVGEVSGFLVERAALAEAAGVERSGIAIDPGIGFGKTVDHNLLLLRDLGVLADLGYPLVVGTSRKSFLGKVTGRPTPRDRDLASAVSVALAVERGADIVRVHNVSACREAALLALAIVRGSGG